MFWIMAGGVCLRVGGTVWDILKEGGTEKGVGEVKILKKKGQAGSRDRWREGSGISDDVYIYIVAGK